MSDVDKLQNAEEKMAQLEEEAAKKAHDELAKYLSEETVKSTSKRPREWKSVPLESIVELPNIRTEIEDIPHLAKSIRERGLLTPLVVMPASEENDIRDEDENAGQYKLIAGARRLAALKMLGEESVMCEIIHDLDESEAYELMFTENIQRQDLPPMQAARALRYLLDLNPDMSAAKLARSLGLEPEWVRRHFRMLELPREVQESLDNGDLSFTVADMLRRAIKSERIDKAAAVEAIVKLKEGDTTPGEIRKLATPPPRTVPKSEVEDITDSASKDCRPMQRPDRADSEPSDAMYRQIMQEMPRPSNYVEGEVIDITPEPISQDREWDGEWDQRYGAQQVWSDVPEPDRNELQVQVDRYMLRRALQEWAPHDYLDQQDIPKDGINAYVETLVAHEPIEQMRHLVLWIIQNP
jgi:ParB/RepB/Spo0J family partition protein